MVMQQRLDLKTTNALTKDLAKYQTQTLAANSLSSSKEENEIVITFDSAPGVSSATSRVITDRVRAATAAYAARLDRHVFIRQCLAFRFGHLYLSERQRLGAS